ncbi:MAG: YgjP-like metallopeptidase domain-containing protein [Acidimicrobiia bacterium]
MTPDPAPRLFDPEASSVVLSGSVEPAEPFRVEVVRSKKRRRSVSAQLVGDVLRVSIPSWMSHAEEEASVADMVRRFRRRMATHDIDLAERARRLARAHALDTPRSIAWAENLTSVWGLCTPTQSDIRISTRLVGFPTWVLDYVIVHELAHLSVPGHGPDFWTIVNRYPRSERAIGYLIAKSCDDDAPDARC